jgi:hypothetical protein
MQATLASSSKPECPPQEEKKNSDKTDDGKATEEGAKKLPIPTHRRRTKSFRPLT